MQLTQPPAVTATAGARSSKYHSGIAADDDASLARDMEIEMNDLSGTSSCVTPGLLRCMACLLWNNCMKAYSRL